MFPWPCFFGGADRDRTDDLLNAMQKKPLTDIAESNEIKGIQTLTISENH
jgi:hypothetical protein